MGSFPLDSYLAFPLVKPGNLDLPEAYMFGSILMANAWEALISIGYLSLNWYLISLVSAYM